MDNVNQIIYNIYKNIQVFYKYRNLKQIDPFLTNDEVSKRIQKNKYLVIRAVSDTYNDMSMDELSTYLDTYTSKSNPLNVDIVYMIIVYPNTDYDSKRSEFKKILNIITYPYGEVIIINKNKLGAHMNKFIDKLNESSDIQKINVYQYTLFKTIIPEYCLVPKFKILNDDEIKELEKSYINIKSLSRVLESDPQMIWIGAKAGQVVKYTYLSEVTISSIGYSIVCKN